MPSDAAPGEAPDDPLANPLITTFGRLVESFRHLEAVLGRELQESSEMSLTSFEVLLRLSRSPGGELAMGELARQLDLTSGGATRLVDRMIATGEVERRPCATDRRVLYAAITAAGRTRVSAAADSHAASLQRVLAGFSPEDLATLDELLDRLRPMA
jgi:DNA-binding MarR family transcriptional regulator